MTQPESNNDENRRRLCNIMHVQELNVNIISYIIKNLFRAQFFASLKNIEHVCVLIWLYNKYIFFVCEQILSLSRESNRDIKLI